MGKYYLSKNYKEITSAGNKAKTDIENILKKLGYKNSGLAQTHYSNNILGFLITLIGVLKVGFTISKNDIVVLQYPFKKYYSFVCNIIHIRGGKVITVIHDLGSFRRKKLTVDKEIKRLNHTDFLIAHNIFMKEWLLQKGVNKTIECLEIFDYLSPTLADERNNPEKQPYKVIYAGGLSYKKNRFLYLLDNLMNHWKFNLYGSGFEWDRIKNKESFNYKGFVPSDKLIAEVKGDFGLVWDGESPFTCSGTFGEYLRYNNPHKTSLYIRCNIPVIIWKEAALASFVDEHHIGICIKSLEELDDILPTITKEEYLKMKQNTKRISELLARGHYLSNALGKAEKYFLGD